MPRAPLRRRQPNRNGPSPRAHRKIPSSSPARLELQKRLAQKPIGQRPDDSDDSDRLVVKGRGRRGRNAPRQEIFASGAVGKGDTPGAHPTRVQRRRSLTKATDDILARTRPDDSPQRVTNKEAPQRPLLAKGNADKATRQRPVPAPVPSSAVKPPASVLRSAQPTPTRENSILGTLKPRRRQPSILQALEPDSSTLDLEDEERFLPDSESTPTNLAISHNVSSTPVTKSSHTSLHSSSKKRKLGPASNFQPALVERTSSEAPRPAASSPDRAGTPEPSLPTVAVSTLRKRGRKSREHIREDEDIMALPRSSSSLSLSPVKPNTPAPTRHRRKKAPKLAPTLATAELQALMMPRKRRRTARTRTQMQSEFDIPVDSDSHRSEKSDPADEEDESIFLPAKKGRKPRRMQAAVNRGFKAGGGTKRGTVVKQSGRGAANRSNANTSTSHLMATKEPVLAPCTPILSGRNHSTKSPSQLSTVNSSNLNTKRTNNGRRRNGQGKSKQLGGSPHGSQDHTGADKENFDLQHHGSLDESGIETPERGPTSVKSSGGRLDTTNINKAKTAITTLGKWADVDAWDLDFEDVEVTTGSSGSSPMRR
ncbi:hypothetical protein A1O1_03144 [Capronia coronata CBS 617.96]|uniref:Uncharacterized protein n=1 Tax=Capronia coronata CBS 617.96 TaxID=1182541 RepID=W9YP79_9EURO|nr:uncharacterized protein A1O1_03144 [Capronia coronata CBS 617.96]EXJ94747.1 hypothetical protein A1O1_03144 [Capronia coronata CBS 617.96]